MKDDKRLSAQAAGSPICNGGEPGPSRRRAAAPLPTSEAVMWRLGLLAVMTAWMKPPFSQLAFGASVLLGAYLDERKRLKQPPKSGSVSLSDKGAAQ
jgi:hypothetical protein